MTVTAYTSDLGVVSGYSRVGLDGVSLGVSQTRFVAEEVSLELESIGVADADIHYYYCIWIAEITFNTIYANTSKLRSSLRKYQLGYWDLDYWGTATTSGYLQYLSQRLPRQTCWLSRDAYIYPSLVFPAVLGEVREMFALAISPGFPSESSTTLHYLLDQVDPIGSSLQIQYVAYRYGYATTPPSNFIQF